MLRLPIAATAPSNIDRHDNSAITLAPVADRIAKGVMHHAGKQRHRSHFGCCCKERGDRCRAPFVDVRRPHVERHGRHFESQAGDQENKPNSSPRESRPSARLDNTGEQRRARVAVDQRRAVEQQPETSAPSTKYFKPASVDCTESRRKDATRKAPAIAAPAPCKAPSDRLR